MDVGTGIAIAGVWIFAGLMGVSNTVTSIGLWIGVICAAIVTAVLV